MKRSWCFERGRDDWAVQYIQVVTCRAYRQDHRVIREPLTVAAMLVSGAWNVGNGLNIPDGDRTGCMKNGCDRSRYCRALKTTAIKCLHNRNFTSIELLFAVLLLGRFACHSIGNPSRVDGATVRCTVPADPRCHSIYSSCIEIGPYPTRDLDTWTLRTRRATGQNLQCRHILTFHACPGICGRH